MNVSNENANCLVITNYLSAERGVLTVILEEEFENASSTVLDFSGGSGRFSNLIELSLMNGISDLKSLKGGNFQERFSI
jgi:hypothetical protein